MTPSKNKQTTSSNLPTANNSPVNNSPVPALTREQTQSPLAMFWRRSPMLNPTLPQLAGEIDEAGPVFQPIQQHK